MSDTPRDFEKNPGCMAGCIYVITGLLALAICFGMLVQGCGG